MFDRSSPLRRGAASCATVIAATILFASIGCAPTSAGGSRPESVVGTPPARVERSRVHRATSPLDRPAVSRAVDSRVAGSSGGALVVVAPASVEAVPGFEDARISVDWRAVSARAALRSLAERGGVNIVVDSDVSGTVTFRARDIPVAEAFAAVLVALELGYEYRGDARSGIFRVAPRGEWSDDGRRVARGR